MDTNLFSTSNKVLSGRQDQSAAPSASEEPELAPASDEAESSGDENVSGSTLSRRSLLKGVLGLVGAGTVTQLTSVGRTATAQRGGNPRFPDVLCIPSILRPASQRVAQAELRQRPFSPNNPDLFSNRAYGATPDWAAPIPGYDAVQVEQQLSQILQSRFSQEKVGELLGIYHSEPAIKIIPNPVLRASVVSLFGTPGELSAKTLLSGEIGQVNFATFTSEPAPLASVDRDQDGKPIILVNGNLVFENLPQTASLLAHEAIHNEPSNSFNEEVFANFVQAVTYLYFLNQNPALAEGKTRLSNHNNTLAMALLNTIDHSRDGDKLRLMAKRGDVFPGGNKFKDFVDFMDAIYSNDGSTSEGGKLVQDYVQYLTGSELDGSDFKAAVEAVNDRSVRPEVLSSIELVNAASALDLQLRVMPRFKRTQFPFSNC